MRPVEAGIASDAVTPLLLGILTLKFKGGTPQGFDPRAGLDSAKRSPINAAVVPVEFLTELGKPLVLLRIVTRLAGDVGKGTRP